MKSIEAKITGDDSLIADFIMQHMNTGEKQYEDNVRLARFECEDGNKYAMSCVVKGGDGKKYKLVVTGAQKANYPEGEQVLDGGRDILLARITA